METQKQEIDFQTKKILKQEQSKAINMYYRAEGTFVFSLIGLLVCVFLWDDLTDPVYFFVGGALFQFLFMMFFLYRHLKFKGVL